MFLNEYSPSMLLLCILVAKNWLGDNILWKPNFHGMLFSPQVLFFQTSFVGSSNYIHFPQVNDWKPNRAEFKKSLIFFGKFPTLFGLIANLAVAVGPHCEHCCEVYDLWLWIIAAPCVLWAVLCSQPPICGIWHPKTVFPHMPLFLVGDYLLSMQSPIANIAVRPMIGGLCIIPALCVLWAVWCSRAAICGIGHPKTVLSSHVPLFFVCDCCLGRGSACFFSGHTLRLLTFGLRFLYLCPLCLLGCAYEGVPHNARWNCGQSCPYFLQCGPPPG